MPDSFVSTNIKMKKPDWYPSIRRYEQSHLWKAIWQLLNTFIPYFLVCILIYLSYIAGYSYWIILCLSILAAGLLVRIFIFFHDCAHQSFFTSRKANTVLGYVCGILTFTPYEEWRKSHGWHHNTFGDLD
jgi:omega-6 fatty acid desaturase (delta-12 desaturase)